MPVMQGLFGGDPVAFVGNNDLTVLSSAVRTATISSDDIQAYFSRGVYIYLKVTAIADTPSIVLTIEGKMINGDYVTLLTAAAVTTVSTNLFLLHPDAGAAAEGVDQVVNFPLTLNWRVTVTHGDADSITYTVLAVMLM